MSLKAEFKQRAQEMATLAQAHHEGGRLPMPVGARFMTPHAKEHGLPPWEVLSHYADDKNPERYGYNVQRGAPGSNDYERSRLLVHDPESQAKTGVDYPALAEQFESMTGPRTTKAEGGSLSVPKVHGPKLHVGPINSAVAGRTDHLPIHVPSGAYVIPADIISSMGEGNTIAGFRHMRRIFGGTPYAGGKEPYGHKGGPYSQGKEVYGQSGGPYGEPLAHMADGGSVPIVAAGGEYVLSPHEVLQTGDGDIDAGHKVLDEFVKRQRAKTVKTLKALPGPRKD